MNKPLIGIIGSEGKMGKAFSQLFVSREFEVIGADLNTDLSGEQVARKADILIFSVPITRTVEVIRELSPLAKSGALIADFTSIKSPAVQALLESAPESCEVLGLHPMFGPEFGSDLKQQVIVSCPVRSGTLAEQLLDFFRSEGAHIKECSAEEHDRMMSLIQGITHISAIATGMAMKKLGFQINKSLDFSSPIYKLRLDMVGRVLSQSPELYAEIAIENPLTEQSLTAYQEAITLLMKTVQERDENRFVQAFREAADFMGDFKNQAYRRTNHLLTLSKNIS
ncbi:MAG: prephenate dehydrogenase/arogenate dehydrogenase family protein [bacterium]|nr:prephenate dehydrogenase/arogenate dehydrogenase family protein [bacterium]